MVLSLRRKSSSSNRNSRRVLCLIVQTVVSLSLFPGSAAGAAALKFGSAGSTRVACPTSVPERLEL